MSKAFTRESDDGPDRPESGPRRAPLPAGAKNYLTEDGARRMQEELARLLELEAEKRCSGAEDADIKRERQALSQRIVHLRDCLATAVVVAVPAGMDDQVRFGAYVTVRNGNGEESTYRIVGVDEMDIDRGWVSWMSPIARALLNRRAGERVMFRFPSGVEELEIVNITNCAVKGNQ